MNTYSFKERNAEPYVEIDITKFSDALLWKALRWEYRRARNYDNIGPRLLFHFDTMKNLSPRGKKIIKELYTRGLYTHKTLTNKLIRMSVA